MNPKEKAKELVYKFEAIQRQTDFEESIKSRAKKCALVAVDEIINCDSFFPTFEGTRKFTAFWYEVQNELNKM
jgi:hypothetical protein